jgi:tetratricopeptide (TPR) repeat protein
MERYPEAKRSLLRSLALSEKAYGPDHPAVAATILNLANVEHLLGDVRGAEAMYERALRLLERAYGPDHPMVALATGNLATAIHARGDLKAAKLLYERALAIDEKRLGSGHPETALTLHNLGRLARAEGRHDDAIDLLQRALSVWDGHEGVDGHEGAAELELVLALWENGAKTRAIELARRAQQRTPAEGAREEDLVAVREFLAEHDRP